jgi:threonine synthase
MIRAAAIGADLAMPELYLWVESDGPTHTLKDRIAPRLADAALASGAAELTVGTCGNLGAALALACRHRGLGCHAFVPARYRRSRGNELHRLGARVVPVRGAYEDAVEASVRFAEVSGAFEASPVGPAASVAIEAYAELGGEILRAAPAESASVWLPVGNGTAAVGLHLGFAREGATPAICVVGSAGNTAVTASVAAGRVVELDPGALTETPVNEPLVNWRSLHAAGALAAVTASGGCSYEATDAELLQAQYRLRAREGVQTTPAGGAGLAGLAAANGHLDHARAHVMVVTSGSAGASAPVRSDAGFLPGGGP